MLTERLKLNPGAYKVQIKTQHFGVMNLVPNFVSIQNKLDSTFVSKDLISYVEQIIQIHIEDFTLVNFEKKPKSLDGGSWAPS